MFERNENFVESLEMARKLIRKFSFFFTPLQNVRWQNSAGVDGGLSGGSSMSRPESSSGNFRVNFQVKMFCLITLSSASLEIISFELYSSITLENETPCSVYSYCYCYLSTFQSLISWKTKEYNWITKHNIITNNIRYNILWSDI